MAGFKTKLTALEKIKKNNENKALMEYVQKQKDLSEKIKQKDLLIIQLRNALQNREEAPAHISNKNELNIIQLYIDGLKQKIIKQMHAIQVAQKNTEKSKIILLEKSKEKKVVSKLIELRKDAYLKKRNKKIENDFSELYTILHARQMKEARK